jgi:hypothetical protein
MAFETRLRYGRFVVAGHALTSLDWAQPAGQWTGIFRLRLPSTQIVTGKVFRAKEIESLLFFLDLMTCQT